MTEEITSALDLPGMVVDSAPAEQRSVEMVTTEPKEPIETLETESEPTPEPEQPKVNEADESAWRTFAAEAKVAELQRQLDETKPKAKEFSKAPELADYATLEEWQKDTADYYKAEGRKEYDGELTAKSQATKQAEQAAAMQTKAQAARAKYADFNQVVQPLVGVMDAIPILRDFNANNPLGLEVSYELAKQPALLEQLKKAPMWEAGEMLINMANRLKTPIVIKQSSAPEPIKTVGNREVGRPNLLQLAANDINGFMKLRNKQEMARKRLN